MRQMVRKSKEEYHELQDLNTSLSERVSERTEELEKLNAQARELEETIARNVAEILEA